MATEGVTFIGQLYDQMHRKGVQPPIPMEDIEKIDPENLDLRAFDNTNLHTAEVMTSKLVGLPLYIEHDYSLGHAGVIEDAWIKRNNKAHNKNSIWIRATIFDHEVQRVLDKTGVRSVDKLCLSIGYQYQMVNSETHMSAKSKEIYEASLCKKPYYKDCKVRLVCSDNAKHSYENSKNENIRVKSVYYANCLQVMSTKHAAPKSDPMEVDTPILKHDVESNVTKIPVCFAQDAFLKNQDFIQQRFGEKFDYTNGNDVASLLNQFCNQERKNMADEERYTSDSKPHADKIIVSLNSVLSNQSGEKLSETDESRLSEFLVNPDSDNRLLKNALLTLCNAVKNGSASKRKEVETKKVTAKKIISDRIDVGDTTVVRLSASVPPKSNVARKLCYSDVKSGGLFDSSKKSGNFWDQRKILRKNLAIHPSNQ
jgi:hypothetical protein